MTEDDLEWSPPDTHWWLTVRRSAGIPDQLSDRFAHDVIVNLVLSHLAESYIHKINRKDAAITLVDGFLRVLSAGELDHALLPEGLSPFAFDDIYRAVSDADLYNEQAGREPGGRVERAARLNGGRPDPGVEVATRELVLQLHEFVVTHPIVE